VGRLARRGHGERRPRGRTGPARGRGGPRGRPAAVALRVNPGILISGHQHVATGHHDAKFGVSAADALAAWAARARWPHLLVDGVHLHVGSQLTETGPLEDAARAAIALARASAERGAPLSQINLGGGFGIDYEAGATCPARAPRGAARRDRGRGAVRVAVRAGALARGDARHAGRRGALGQDARRGGRRAAVRGAGRRHERPDPARALRRGPPHRARAPARGEVRPATVVGPVCESGDTFATDVPLPR